ncbi:GNAT family N-acetyltransferase [Vibrio gallicus]|uniref:GNAT family N-acetyltransferase n=1 Tax=Vibrio gallicus TaxID=190897 RepID=UPI0021C4226B|nr:GNAT family N-acetyltransferase [Vibrio gallicus]
MVLPNTQICIETPNLLISNLVDADWDMFHSLYTDTDVIKHCFDQPQLPDIKNKFVDRVQPWLKESDSWLCLTIQQSNSSVKFGITGFWLDGDTAEVGFLLRSQFQGKGYGTESLSALIHWAERHHGIDKFRAVVTQGNIASERVLHKCGFRLQKIIPDVYQMRGQLYSDLIYER